MDEKREHEIYVSAKDGLFLSRGEGDEWSVFGHLLKGHQLTCVASWKGRILAGTREGVLLSDDGGQSWRESSEGLKIPHIRCIAHHYIVPGLVFAGTEPAGIYVSRDGGTTWEGRREVEILRDRMGWHLPYSPEAGCVRSFASEGRRIYAAAEVGGILRSDDEGDTWYLIGGENQTAAPRGTGADDVHSVVMPGSGSGEFIYAATGGGLYFSSDGGRSWESLYDCYCRAVWVDPEDPGVLVFSPATKRGWLGSIARSNDSGRTWHDAGKGAETPWPGKMIERFCQIGESLVALRSDGVLFSSPVGTQQWDPILEEIKNVSDVAQTF